MLAKSILVSALALFFASSAIAAPEIASDPISACNCPNNCSHKQGSSCEYYGGTSTHSDKVKGVCENEGGFLSCVG